MAKSPIDIAESLARLSASTIFELRGEWWRLHRAPAGSGVVRGKRGGPFLPLFARARSVERDSPFIRVDLDRDARNR